MVSVQGINVGHRSEVAQRKRLENVNTLIREVVIFEQRPEGGEEVSHETI